MFMAGAYQPVTLLAMPSLPTITPMRYTSSVLKVEAMTTSEG